MLSYTMIGRCLVLLIVANSAPILARNLLGEQGNWPVDRGLAYRDGRPLLGPTKTLRGMLAAICATALVAPLVDINVVSGALFGFCSMLGDLVSSFTKRRLGIESSASVLGLDQGLEALCPLFVFRVWFDLKLADIFIISVAFFALNIVFSPLLHRLHIRSRPR
jgi:predicted CDP-diglyceride synthetase/phosphatidate cytidylyltransferase